MEYDTQNKSYKFHCSYYFSFVISFKNSSHNFNKGIFLLVLGVSNTFGFGAGRSIGSGAGSGVCSGATVFF